MQSKLHPAECYWLQVSGPLITSKGCLYIINKLGTSVIAEDGTEKWNMRCTSLWKRMVASSEIFHEGSRRCQAYGYVFCVQQEAWQTPRSGVNLLNMCIRCPAQTARPFLNDFVHSLVVNSWALGATENLTDTHRSDGEFKSTQETLPRLAHIIFDSR